MARKTKEVMVTEVLERGVLSYDTLDSAEEQIKAWRERYGPTHTNLHLSREPELYSDGYYTCLVGERPENEKERRAREEMQERRQDLRRRQYEALKKEFEK